MEVLLQRARSFATDAAKKSQDLAKEAAKISQEIASETAKRSKELATEASKKADQLKALAGDITLPIPSTSEAAPLSLSSSSSAASEEELIKYGITAELREFVHGLTVSTFQDFPSEGLDSDSKEEVGTSNVRQDLTQWQEQHALLVLKAVPEISRFRYDLCPRHMKEKRFWRIYFTVVRSHLVLYEAPPVVPEDFLGIQPSERATVATASSIEAAKVAKLVELTEKKRAIEDQDLDAYLLGDSDGDGEDVGSDAEFDQLVTSSALDSDVEDEKQESKKASSSAKASEGSSDGELV